MWQVLTSGQESNFSGGFKLKTCNNVQTKICCERIVKMLWMYLGVYTVQCNQFWRGFLHRAYREWFHPMLDRTSLLEDKNRSTQGVINLSGLMLFVWLYGLDF